MAAEEQKQWDLTKEELKKLKAFQVREEAVKQLTKTLLAQLAENHEATLKQGDAWWKAITVKYKIPDAYKGKLVTVAEVGKFWVKGEVPELDEILRSYNQRLLNGK